jgi:hypothetical protein
VLTRWVPAPPWYQGAELGAPRSLPPPLGLRCELVQPPCAATRAVASRACCRRWCRAGVEEALGVWVAHWWCRRFVPRWLCTAPAFGGPGHLAGVRSKLKRRSYKANRAHTHRCARRAALGGLALLKSGLFAEVCRLLCCLFGVWPVHGAGSASTMGIDSVENFDALETRLLREVKTGKGYCSNR